MIEPPYGIILKALRRGNVVPFLGAGASLVRRGPDTAWVPGAGTLPSAAELTNALADEASFPSADPHDRDLAKVASYYADVSGRPKLREYLRELLTGPHTPGPLHALLASFPTPLLIVQTNYDMLLEQAFLEAEKPFDLVVYSADRKEFANAVLLWRHGEERPEAVDPKYLDIDPTKTSVLFKMHGTVGRERADWDSFVITEDDYIEFLSRMTTNTAVPPIFFDHFATRSFLFLGYGLRDWNLRVVLKNLQKHFTLRSDPDSEVPRSWAIQLQPSEVERALWAHRNVEIYNVDLDTFVEKLRAREPKP